MTMPAAFKVVRTDRELEMTRVDQALRDLGGTLVVLPDGTPEAELAREVADADLLLMCYAPITARVIDGATRLKAIVKYGVGIDAIDIDAARARGIPVVNVPAYAEETVAEGAFALADGACSSASSPSTSRCSSEGWIWPESRWLASDLSGKTLGLLGLGRIGRSVARMAAGFRMTVLAHDPLRRPGAGRRSGRRTVPRPGRDDRTLRCTVDPLRAEQGHAPAHRCGRTGALQAVGRAGERVARRDRRRSRRCCRPCRPAAWRVRRSTSTAASRLSQQGHPLSALYAMDQVLLWPHLTFYTHEAMQRLEDDTLARCLEALSGQPVTVRSTDPRLLAQTRGVRFEA